jgi:hypothetical protein
LLRGGSPANVFNAVRAIEASVYVVSAFVRSREALIAHHHPPMAEIGTDLHRAKNYSPWPLLSLEDSTHPPLARHSLWAAGHGHLALSTRAPLPERVFRNRCMIFFAGYKEATEKKSNTLRHLTSDPADCFRIKDRGRRQTTHRGERRPAMGERLTHRSTFGKGSQIMKLFLKFLLAWLSISAAQAQYPNRLIKFVMTYPPAGVTAK